MKIGNRIFNVKEHCYIMGILNVTPDSFSDGGRWNTVELALKQAQNLIAQGADILDIGGESTRPGYTKVSPEEEIERTAPVIQAIKSRFDIPVSVDTCKGAVAKAALQAGAVLVNDIWGLQYDPGMAGIIKEAGAACCLMFNRETTPDALYPDLIEGLKESVHLAKKAGIPKDAIILDPGIGFAKTQQMNLECLNTLEKLKALDYPILLGASRKSVIGYVLDLPVEQRLEGTLALTALGVMKGCAFIRVHDVAPNKRVVKMLEAILQEKGI